MKQTFTELLPKFSVMYSFDETRNLYLTIAKGYKSGGFNTQIFSDVLQQKMMNRMGIGEVYDVQRGVAYKPEYSWNYEIGGHFSCMEGAVRGDFALFYIDCRDQQLTVFPPGQTTGRMMTNAGRTRSLGAEAAVQISPWRTFDINLAYGYTDARFVRYETTVKNDDGDPVRISYKDNRIPYAPQHTLSAGAAWTDPDRREMARRSGVSGRRPLRGPHLVERGKYAFTTFLRAYGRFGTLRTRPLLAQRLGPQPRRRRLRRILFQIDRQRVRPARTPPHIRHHTEH